MVQAQEKADPYVDSADNDEALGLESALDDAGGTAGEEAGGAAVAAHGVVTAGRGLRRSPSAKLICSLALSESE